MKTFRNTISVVKVLLVVGIISGTLVVTPAAHAYDCVILPSTVCGSDSQAIFHLLEWVLGILSAGVGIAAIAAFIFAGILYTSAGDNESQVSKAKSIMSQTVIGLVAFAVMALALEWLIPGGVF